jgi:hypothetical protein
MRGRRFKAASTFQQNVMTNLKAVQEEAFSWAFYLLYEQYKHCEEEGYGYIAQW